MNKDQADQTFDISPQARKRAFELIQQKMLNGSVVTDMDVRHDFIVWFFNDNTFVELMVVRDCDDNNKPVYVAVTHCADYKIDHVDRYSVK